MARDWSNLTRAALALLVALLATLTAGPSVVASSSLGAGAGGPVVASSPRTDSSHASTTLTPSGARSAATQNPLLLPTEVYGYVLQGEAGLLPVKVRAVSVTGVNCGTSDVTPIVDISGRYATAGAFSVQVSNSNTREGCPDVGASISFQLLYGDIGDGAFATPNEPVPATPGASYFRLLLPGDAVPVGGWAGDVPPPGGYGLLVWEGPSVPTAAAAELLGVPVETIWHQNEHRSFDIYVPNAPAFVQTYLHVDDGDIVVVRAR